MTLVGDTAFTLPKQENKNNKKKKTTAKQKQPKTPTPHSSPAVHSSSPFRAYMSFQNFDFSHI
jgi:hypothetical protein